MMPFSSFITLCFCLFMCNLWLITTRVKVDVTMGTNSDSISGLSDIVLMSYSP